MTGLTNAEKVRIVKRHIEEDVPMNVLSAEYGISPEQIYLWRRQLAEAAVSRRLLEAGLVSRNQVQRAVAYQRAHGGRTVDALIELGFLHPEALVSFMVKQQGIPSLNLRHYHIPPEVAGLVSRRFAKERLSLPVDRMGHLLTVAMACPVDTDTLHEISRLTGLTAKPVFAEKGDIEWAIEGLYRGNKKEAALPGAPHPTPAHAARPDMHPVPEQDIVNLIGLVDVLPLSSGSMQLLQQAMGDGRIDEERLVRAIMMDPLMTTRLLALANVEALGQPGQVRSLRQAVKLLGAEKVCSLVGAADTVRLYSHWDHFHLQTYWSDAVCCAKAASLIADRWGMGRSEDFYTAGLLHDIGRIALFEILPLHYARTDGMMTGVELLIQENELVGMAHTTAGYRLAQHWHFPDEFAQAILCHHFPEQAQRASDFAAVVSIGNAMADCIRRSDVMDDEALATCRTAMKMIGLQEKTLLSLFEEYLTLLPSPFLTDIAI